MTSNHVASIVESSMSKPLLMSENLPAYATITTQIFYEIPFKKRASRSKLMFWIVTFDTMEYSLLTTHNDLLNSNLAFNDECKMSWLRNCVRVCVDLFDFFVYISTVFSRLFLSKYRNSI